MMENGCDSTWQGRQTDDDFIIYLDSLDSRSLAVRSSHQGTEDRHNMYVSAVEDTARINRTILSSANLTRQDAPGKEKDHGRR
jgi:hypothetical protein